MGVFFLPLAHESSHGFISLWEMLYTGGKQAASQQEIALNNLKTVVKVFRCMHVLLELNCQVFPLSHSVHVKLQKEATFEQKTDRLKC